MAIASSEARLVQDRLELNLARSGLVWGVISGATWGLSGVLMGMALVLAPFTSGGSLLAVPLAGAAMEEGSAAFFMFWYSLFTGRFMEYGRIICTKTAWFVLCAAMCGGPLAMSFYLVGINWCGAAYALSITGLFPAISALVGCLWLKERLVPRAWFGIAMSVAGGILVGYAPPSGHYPHFLAGVLLSIVAGVGWGLEGNFAAFAADTVDPDMVVSLREAASFFVYLIAIMPLAGALILFGHAVMTPSVMWIMLGAGVAGAVSYIAYYRCCNLTGAGRGGALNMTYAMFGILFAWLLAHSPMTVTLYIGCGVTTVGAILISANPRELFQLRKKKEEYTNA
jgi:drug/metabolite transporter (DMT)-like permease